MRTLLMQIRSAATEWQLTLTEGLKPVAIGKGPTFEAALLDLAKHPYINQKEIEKCR